jgi:hypothetical protein
MTFTTEQKTQLAKLMATENLSVQHQKIRTARFDPVNRVLYLPIWQNMSGSLYDLLCGHEVGHALYTPAEGWHDAVVNKSKGKNYKSFLNVVEDARIEKKVKRKYPGLTNSFKVAYQELMKRDFFGLCGRDITKMAFIERLNIYTKSQYTATYIPFNDRELAFIDKILAMETWNDVLSVTDEIYEYSKSEQFELQLQDFQSFKMSGIPEEDYDDEYSDEYEFDDSYDLESDSQSGENDGDGEGENSDEQSDSDGSPKTERAGEDGGEKKDGKGQNSDTEGEGDEVDSDEDGQSVNRHKESSEARRDMFSPKCETDENYRNNETSLLDEKSKEYLYVSLPKPNYKNIITPYKRVQQVLTDYYKTQVEQFLLNPENVNKWVSEFKVKNDRYVSLLAKEFEMRKAAKAFSKSKLSDTGDIDINKLSSYQFDDNIFRKMMLVPKGKNHGLILLLDYSGSMSDNMSGSIEQILVLAMFCRKVNIPFHVYSFGDSIDAHMLDINVNHYDYHKNSKQYDCFEVKDGDLGLSNVYLREYLSSRMSNSEFNTALKNMILLKKSYEGGRYYRSVGRPENEWLSNTPMVQALVATAGVMNQFKKQNNLDLCSLVVVHDGDADSVNRVRYTEVSEGRKFERNRGFDNKYVNVILTDKSCKYQKMLSSTNYHRDEMSTNIFDWFRHATGAKVFGFFLIAGGSRSVKNAIMWKHVEEDGSSLIDIRNIPERQHEVYLKQQELAKKLRSEKFLISHRPGYNSFFLISGGSDLNIDDEELEVVGKVTSGKLKNAFMKMNKKKSVNRVLVSKFIQGIAA